MNAIGPRTPEARAALWKRLARMATEIRDEETRAQYLATWRSRYDAAFPPPPPGLSEEAMLPDGSGGARLADQTAKTQAVLRRVAQEWLDRQLTSLRPTTPESLNLFAWWLGRRMAAELIDRDTGDAAIDELVAGMPGAVPTDIDASIAAGERKGYDLDRELTLLRCSRLERTDLGNAERFREWFGRDFLYTTAKGWLGYEAALGVQLELDGAA